MTISIGEGSRGGHVIGHTKSGKPIYGESAQRSTFGPKNEPSGMTSGQINKELDKLDAQGSKLTDKFITTGRGHEKPSETFTKSDPLAIEYKAIQERKSSLHSEIERRYGSGAPRRLPPGFKKRT